MQLKSTIAVPLPGTDMNGNQVPAHPDYVVLSNLIDGEPKDPEKAQEAIKEFCKNVEQYKGYLAINENFETTYIPPYDDIAAVIRHKFGGNEFIIVDLSKVDKTAFILGNRVNYDTEIMEES